MAETHPLVVFDDGLPELSPLTDLRPVFAVRVGGMSLLERVERAVGRRTDGLWVPEGMRAVAGEGFEGRVIGSGLDESAIGDGAAVFVSGRVGRVEGGLDVDGLEPGACLVDGLGGLVAVCCEVEEFEGVLAGGADGLDREVVEGVELVCRPWDAVRLGGLNLRRDAEVVAAELLASGKGTVVGGAEGVLRRGSCSLVAEDGVDLWPGVVLDVTGGPIVLGAGTVVRPNAVLVGPMVLGASNTVLDGAQVREVSTGPHVKLGGEVKGVTVQGYSNKGHNGYLGDSWIGEWVNLGAETVGSNLLNTYGEVTSVAQPGGSRERTGMQFFGAVLGDHVKTAIGTRLMTGSVAHTGVMWAATEALSGCVPAFTWATDAGKKAYRFEKFVEVARAMMGRRGKEPSGAYVEALRACSER